MHYGDALYRDGDYYGREINQAARVVARAGGGEPHASARWRSCAGTSTSTSDTAQCAARR